MKKHVNVRVIKPMVYRTRMLHAGEIVRMDAREGLRHLAQRKVRLTREQAEIPPPPPAIVQQIAAATSEVEELREHCRVMGIRYDGRWGAARLREALETGQ